MSWGGVARRNVLIGPLWRAALVSFVAACGVEPSAPPPTATVPGTQPTAVVSSATPPPSTSPSAVASNPTTTDCGTVIASTNVSRHVRGASAVVSGTAGLSSYDVGDDSLTVLDKATSRYGLTPRFRSSGQVSYVRLREPPDGTHLWGQDSLYEFDLQTGMSTEVIRLPNHVLGYAWNSDGTILAYQLRVEQESEVGPVHLCTFDSRTGTLELLRALQPPIGTGTGQREEAAVAWSPDDRSILVTDTAEEPSLAIVDGQGRDVVQPRDGTFARWLSHDAAFYQENPHTDSVSRWLLLTTASDKTQPFEMPQRAYRPALSPGGDLVAFDDGDAEIPSIFVYDITRRTTRHLIRGYVGPVWLGPNLLAASGAGPCPGQCPRPWSLLGTATAIDLMTGRAHAITLPTTLQEDPRYGAIDVLLSASAPMPTNGGPG